MSGNSLKLNQRIDIFSSSLLLRAPAEATECSRNAPAWSLPLLLLEPQDAPTMFPPDPHICCQGHRMLLQRSYLLPLLLLESQDAPATLLETTTCPIHCIQ